MLEPLPVIASLLGLSSLSFAYCAFSFRQQRDEARIDLNVERNVAKALEGRVNTLRGDNIALTKRAAELSEKLTEAERQIGRMEAEARARAPKRGAKGRFVAKPKALKPPKPISCG